MHTTCQKYYLAHSQLGTFSHESLCTFKVLSHSIQTRQNAPLSRVEHLLGVKVPEQTYVYRCAYAYIYIYIYIQGGREKQTEVEKEPYLYDINSLIPAYL